MEKLVIQGGIKLFGEVEVSGAKNSALPILCASLLTSDRVRIRNLPHLQDVTTMLTLLGHIGVDVELDEKMGVILSGANLDRLQAPYDLVRTMRASVLVLGPLVARFGKAQVSLPGGCAIGQRPVDQHIKGLEAMGASVQIDQGYLSVSAKRLVGAEIVFGTDEGQRVLRDIVANSFVLDTTFDPDPHATVFNEGMRNTALRILSILHYKPVDFFNLPQGVESNEY